MSVEEEGREQEGREVTLAKSFPTQGRGEASFHRDAVKHIRGGAPPASAAGLLNVWVSRHAPTTQIEEIMILATAVIGDKDKAERWLSEPNIALKDLPPIDLIGEPVGFERVRALLLRIEFGVLA